MIKSNQSACTDNYDFLIVHYELKIVYLRFDNTLFVLRL